MLNAVHALFHKILTMIMREGFHFQDGETEPVRLNHLSVNSNSCLSDSKICVLDNVILPVFTVKIEGIR